MIAPYSLHAVSGPAPPRSCSGLVRVALVVQPSDWLSSHRLRQQVCYLGRWLRFQLSEWIGCRARPRCFNSSSTLYSAALVFLPLSWSSLLTWGLLW